VIAKRRQNVSRLAANVVWRLVDAALDTAAPLVGLGAAAGIGSGYLHAVDRAAVTVAKVGSQIIELPYEMFTKGGLFLDNQFLQYGLATFGDVASNLARNPGRTLVALAAGYIVAKGAAKISSHYRLRWMRRPAGTLAVMPR
jgi:hypothetical protein